VAAVVEESKESVAEAVQPAAAGATSVAKKANPFADPVKAPVDSIKSRMLKAASDQSPKMYLFMNP